MAASCRRCMLSGVAGFFGLSMVVTGWTVYQLGQARLQGATQEVCNLTSATSYPCSYSCGGGNCSGTYYTYTASAPARCGADVLTFSERREPRYLGDIGFGGITVRRAEVAVCRCAPSSAPGACFAAVPDYAAGETYPCTVRHTCRDFDLQNPADDTATGLLNLLLGSVFLLFAVSPERFAITVSGCVTRVGAALVPAVAGVAGCLGDGLTGWLSAVGSFAAAPAHKYTSLDEDTP
eukprot:TRINITY_DN72158_c0_g1_i1.p1 TRINITY_DN72158_c0_g1~~TRINITY_DN72158_c0_g1_i1.p1  ORF type:complete len:271 (+),score=65.83 TRINITY_DN72158_c0_g1_i1:106-813(+)